MLRMVLLGALSMSVGWGFRGDYGHETGAILPGALFGLSIAMGAGRVDWLRRATLIAFFCGLGWAVGGQMSYGIVIGYTNGDQLLDVTYGYASLFLIGALWGGVGAAALGLSLAWPRRELARFAWPLTAIGVAWLLLDSSGWTEWLSRDDGPALIGRWAPYDADWVAAASALIVSVVVMVALPSTRQASQLLALLAFGWLAGFAVLVDLLGLRMTPPRSDNWAGCVGLFVALLAWLFKTRQHAVLVLVSAGLLAGGFGFAIGDFWQTLGRAKWGPLGSWPLLVDLNYWKVMEQFFGLLMGWGVAWGVVRFVRGGLATADNNLPRGTIDTVALVFLLIVHPWTTIGQNVGFWRKDGTLPAELAGISTGWWVRLAAGLVTAVIGYAICRQRRGNFSLAPHSDLGRAQWLYLILLWGSLAGDFSRHVFHISDPGTLFVHLSFWITAAIASYLVLSIPEPELDLASDTANQDRIPAASPVWKLSAAQRGLWLLAPVTIVAIGWLSVASHDEPVKNSRRRFGSESVEAK